MSRTLMNAIDLARAMRLMPLIEASGNGSIDIYTAGDFVKIEIDGRGLNPADVAEVFNRDVTTLLVGDRR